MIERLSGTCAAITSTGIVVDVGGVGYGVEMPLSALCEIAGPGAPITLWTYTHVREDAIRLFGFLRLGERQAFETLISVSGVGPKVALALLSTLTVSQLVHAIETGAERTFSAAPGIGPRLAERLVVELKPKLKRLQSAALLATPSSLRSGAVATAHQGELFDLDGSQNAKGQDSIADDVRSALENLGFREKDVSQVLQKVIHKGLSFPEIMKSALVQLAPGGVRSPSHGS